MSLTSLFSLFSQQQEHFPLSRWQFVLHMNTHPTRVIRNGIAARPRKMENSFDSFGTAIPEHDYYNYYGLMG